MRLDDSESRWGKKIKESIKTLLRRINHIPEEKQSDSIFFPHSTNAIAPSTVNHKMIPGPGHYTQLIALSTVLTKDSLLYDQ